MLSSQVYFSPKRFWRTFVFGSASSSVSFQFFSVLFSFCTVWVVCFRSLDDICREQSCKIAFRNVVQLCPSLRNFLIFSRPLVPDFLFTQLKILFFAADKSNPDKSKGEVNSQVFTRATFIEILTEYYRSVRTRDLALRTEEEKE